MVNHLPEGGAHDALSYIEHVQNHPRLDCGTRLSLPNNQQGVLIEIDELHDHATIRVTDAAGDTIREQHPLMPIPVHEILEGIDNGTIQVGSTARERLLEFYRTA